jgi:hypothetical protein
MVEWKNCQTCDGKGAFYGETCDTCGGVGKVSISPGRAPSSATTAGERQSIDTPEFRNLLTIYRDADHGQSRSARAALIAHIDTWAARSAGDAVPAGFKLVPLVPDKRMLHAGMGHFWDKIEPATKAWKCYRDMIGAAPASGNTAQPTAYDTMDHDQLSKLGQQQKGEHA